MRVISHTTNVDMPDFHALEVEWNVNVKGAAIDLAQQEMKCHAFIRDFPNWDLVAGELGFVDEEGHALPKPEFPLTSQVVNETLPLPLAIHLSSQLGVTSAISEYVRECAAPNSKRT